MDIKSYKLQFLEYLEIEKNRSRKTIENYDHYLTRFVDFVGTTKKPENLSEDDIRKYRLHLNRLADTGGKSLKKVTQNYHVIALRAFLKYLAKRDVSVIAPEKVELGKQEDREVGFLDKEELHKLLNYPDDITLAGLRDRSILNSLFSTGLRVSELCALNRDEIDLERGEFYVKGKGGKVRIVFLSKDACAQIKQYLSKRVDMDSAMFIRIPQNDRFELFENLRLTPRSVQRIVKNYASLAGVVGKKVSPHTLRHSFATDLLRNGADIRSVQAMLGHSSVTTTQIYTHVTDKQLRETHEKFHDKDKITKEA